MTKRKFTFFCNLFFILLLGLSPLQSNATHIVGGEMNYTCLGNNEYEITLVIFRDCFYGNPNAWFDDPASIGVFDVNNNLVDEILIPLDEMLNDTLDPVLNNDCLVIPDDVCVHTTTYTSVVSLDFRPGGYQLAYQRCCRNEIIANIVEPLATGVTYSIDITETALMECNSSPRFNDLPPLFICVNEPINFDQSALDLDGDSIVYKLCTPVQGASPDVPRPQPPNPPPYDEVVWIDPPYNVDNMLNGIEGGTPLAIDSETGLLTGLPNTIGQFVVGVCIEEYRAGELISITRRDFQYNVGLCGQSSAAFFAPEFQCNNLMVDFENQSEEADDYLWIFNDPNNLGATSTEVSPSYTYSEAGMYEIILIADPETVCADTFSQVINLELSNLDINYEIAVMDCVDSYEIAITDLSTDDLATPVEWLWEIVGTGFSSMEQNPIFDLTGLAAGEYTLEVSILLDNDCTGMESSTIIVTEPLTFVSSVVNPTCQGDLNGSASIDVTGGTAPYTFLWNTGDTTPTINEIGGGTYTVTVTTANDCEIIEDFVLNEPDAIITNVELSYLSCEEDNSGVAVVSVEGGSEPYTYMWSNGEETATLSGVAAGTYSVTVSDANNCTSVNEVNLLENGGLTIMLTTTDVTCNGADDGSIEVAVAGGFGDYTYEWSSGEDSQDLTNLSAGTFSLTVTDSGGCIATETVTITETTALNLMILVMDVGCESDTALGTACAGVLGGLPPYTFEWSSGATTAMVDGLEVGIYEVTATDANNCMVTASASVNAYDFEVTIDSNPIECNGDLAEFAVAQVSGGEGPFEYLWSNENTSIDITNLAEGTYSVTVSDVMGCETSSSIEIIEPDELAAIVEVRNISCNGAGDGQLSLQITGGTSPYNYAWSNGSGAASIDNLVADDYFVTITDANNCTLETMASIAEPSTLEVELSASNSVCVADADGTISSNVSGGTPPYTFLWSNGETTANLSNLTGGDFTLTVSDASDCTVSAAASIEAFESPSCVLSILQGVVSVNGDEGALAVEITDGTPPYDFSWNTGATEATIDNLSAGTYTVVVNDANACGTSCQVTLTAPPPALIGDYVWNDFNRNGLQDPTELGIPNVFIILEGTNIFGEDILTATYTGQEGDYLFGDLNAGTYQVSFNIPDTYTYSPANQGEDDSIDNDVSEDMTTITDIAVAFGESNLTIDAGFYRECENVSDAGQIGEDQFLCFTTDNPEPIGSIAPPSGGQGDLEIIWMQANLLVPFSNSAWVIIEGATGLSYDPGPLQQTTYFARCVRNAGCANYEESNIVKITIGTGAISSILGPDDVCINESESFAAGLSGDNVSYLWNFGADAIPTTGIEQFMNVAWSTLGDKTISLTVTEDGCETTVHKTVDVSDSPTVCQGLFAPNHPNGTAISLYPNPAQNQVNLTTSQAFETAIRVELMDIHGKKIKTLDWEASTLELTIDIAAYPSGVYYLKVQDDARFPSLLRLVKL